MINFKYLPKKEWKKRIEVNKEWKLVWNEEEKEELNKKSFLVRTDESGCPLRMELGNKY